MTGEIIAKCKKTEKEFRNRGLQANVWFDRVENLYKCEDQTGLWTSPDCEQWTKKSDKKPEEERPEDKDKISDKEDIISHPNHYCAGRKYEPKDVIRDWNLNFNLGNAVKYISRNGRKDGNSSLQDLKKARQYLDFEIDYLESKGEKNAYN